MFVPIPPGPLRCFIFPQFESNTELLTILALFTSQQSCHTWRNLWKRHAIEETISTNHSIGSWIFVLLWFSILTKLEKSKIIKVKRFQAAVQEDIGIKSKMISCFFLIIWGFVLVFNIDLHLITNLAIHRDLSQETS